MFKNINELMKNYQTTPLLPKQPIFGNMKKYIFIFAGLLFMSGFGFGLMIGLLF
jgi:hypothetical protein